MAVEENDQFENQPDSQETGAAVRGGSRRRGCGGTGARRSFGSRRLRLCRKTGTSFTLIRDSRTRWRNRCARAPKPSGSRDKIGQILIPTEEVVELRNGKKVTSKRLVYPGYVLVEMEMNDELWHAVKNTPRVTGFVGGGNSPVPLSAGRSEFRFCTARRPRRSGRGPR